MANNDYVVIFEDEAVVVYAPNIEAAARDGLDRMSGMHQDELDGERIQVLSLDGAKNFRIEVEHVIKFQEFTLGDKQTKTKRKPRTR